MTSAVCCCRTHRTTGQMSLSVWMQPMPGVASSGALGSVVATDTAAGVLVVLLVVVLLGRVGSTTPSSQMAWEHASHDCPTTLQRRHRRSHIGTRWAHTRHAAAGVPHVTCFPCAAVSAITTPYAHGFVTVPPTHASVAQKLLLSPTLYVSPLGHVHSPPQVPTPGASW